METAGKFSVMPLEEGALFVTKQMSAASGTSLPGHRASIESVLVVTDGQCVIELHGTQRVLKQGDSVVVPANVWHQITADPDFSAVHVMPKEIRFDFSK
jgi:quercetin dioxygenase-like cupin family protein